MEMALAGNKQNNHRTANHRETTCSAPPLHMLVQNNYSVNVISKQRSARKIPNLNRNRQTQFCTLQWMYILTGWSLALLCSASLVAAAVPIADFERAICRCFCLALYLRQKTHACNVESTAPVKEICGKSSRTDFSAHGQR